MLLQDSISYIRFINDSNNIRKPSSNYSGPCVEVSSGLCIWVEELGLLMGLRFTGGFKRFVAGLRFGMA